MYLRSEQRNTHRGITMFNDQLQEALLILSQEAERAKEGFTDPVKLYYRLKKGADQLSEIIEDLKNDVIIKVGSQPVEIDGHEISIGSTRRASFKHCLAWKNAHSEQKRIEEIMKTLTVPVIDSETGEEIEPAEFKESVFPVIKKAQKKG